MNYERELEQLRLRCTLKAMPRRGTALSQRLQNIQRDSLSDSRICRSLREILHLRVSQNQSVRNAFVMQKDYAVFLNTHVKPSETIV